MRRTTSVTVRAASALLTVAAATAVCAAPAAATALSDTPGRAPALMNECGMGPLATEPAEVMLTCADANDYVDGIVWGLWSADRAVGLGTEHYNQCEPNCAAGTWASRPALIYLDRPAPVPNTPDARFSHSVVATIDGLTSYRP
ncbi:hypothetical protein G4X40_18270 [Rhodococcus sp. D2-41]|uniref:Secreted protein n=1 Tax=Speluncibacter jeojiensis TaxID=2710754 RepID=A0A9X4LXW2_9ACTN|nr:hypothetical protein [Rhodococcus sp. D2-41]MDG3012091.1 hypothetical protein [Rhodococcus sp. D2-41]MDG3013616.1 hypothetical protein [Corynebacteriales bacterium D3-21]